MNLIKRRNLLLGLGGLFGGITAAEAADTKLSGLPTATSVDYVYGEVGGVSKKIAPANVATRAQLTTNTIFYVNADTGNDSTGSGSIGAPWATIQKAADHVMYEVTGRGVTVTIQVQDATAHYTENLYLGPHEIFDPANVFGTVTLNFSAVGTPANVVIAPSASAYPSLLAIITVENASWGLSGGFTLTRGSTNNSGFASYFGGQLNLGPAAVVFSDSPDIAFDCEFDSQIQVGGGNTGVTTVTFNGTVGTLALADSGCVINFYPLCDFHFSVDPGFTGASGGMFMMDYGGGCSITSRATYSGSSAAAPSKSVISYGNRLIDLNAYQALSNYTINAFSSYNGVFALTSVKVAPTAIAALPATPAAGDIAAVNDALSPVVGSAVSSGGAAFAAVCWNGSAWKVYAA